jgi:hypothetical protein
MGDQVRLQVVDLFLQEASTTTFTLSVYLDENDNTSLEVDVVSPASSLLAKVWVRSYLSVIGQFAQLQFSFSDAQMTGGTISEGDIVIHAMMLWMSNGGRLTYGSTATI